MPSKGGAGCQALSIKIKMAQCTTSPSWFLTTVLTYSLSVSLVSNGVYVAPGDEDPYCLDSASRIPVPPQQKILLDTQDYEEQTLIDSNGGTQRWVSGNFDGLETDGVNYNWRENAQTSVCIHQLLACDPDNQPQDNWLITQFINITDHNVEQLVVNMAFTSALSSCPNCQQSFSMQSYETNIPDETGRVNQSFYQDTGARFFHRQDNEELESAVDSFTITSKGLYLAVVDTGSCTRITRLYMFYYVCPSQVVNMIQYPETVSPPTTNPQDRTAMGTCIDQHASPIDGATLELDCSINGNWETNELGCSCDPGYEIIMDNCQPCMEGEYKLVQGNEECIECPVNSNSTLPGVTSCDCFPGYYRSDNEDVTVGCTAPPTSGDIDANISSTSITITWTPPTNNGGRTDLYYTVAYSNDSFTSTPVNIYNTTQYTITGLTPSTQYTVTVTTNSGVSNQDPDIVDRTVTINVTTSARGPTSPVDVFSSSTQPSIIQWSQPTSLYGILLHYNILVATVDNSSVASVMDTTRIPSFDLTTLNIDPGVYYIWVQAVTNNGLGDLSASIRHVEVGFSSLYYGLGFLSGVISTVIIELVCVVIIAIIYHTLVKGKTYSKQATDPSATNPSVTGNREKFGGMISTDTNPSYSGVQYNSRGVGTLATPEYVTII